MFCNRIFNLTKHWMAMQWLDFEDNPELVQRMRELINVMNITGMQNIAEQLERQLVRGVCLLRTNRIELNMQYSKKRRKKN